MTLSCYLLIIPECHLILTKICYMMRSHPVSFINWTPMKTLKCSSKTKPAKFAPLQNFQLEILVRSFPTSVSLQKWMRTCLAVILAQFTRDLNCDLFLFRPSWNTPGLFFMTIIWSNTNWSWPFSVKFRSLLRRVQQLLAHLFFQSFKLCFGRNGKPYSERDPNEGTRGGTHNIAGPSSHNWIFNIARKTG